ncbi:MAG: hypothetical protein JO171_01750 [Paludibacterium sp.]|uniref:hypothetical protein n=1 Tax=Paludibacterium sp. TaxID=1917523 RepID=UPI0025D7617E|nr:hypothetical protein [Paludibacterium sp.]MBV8045850.1 hypothetical protein [Paludibacterium sp.]MBV8646790.1 hypothetical protein [Paludibacterium sp.]
MCPALLDAAPCAMPAAGSPAAIYQLAVHPDTPDLVEASLTLPADGAGEMWLGAQGVTRGLSHQILQPRCGAEPLVEQDRGWVKPAGCRRVDWQIRFDTVRDDGADPARQRSLYFPDRSWWLLSEGTSLLRPKHAGLARLTANLPVLGGGEPAASAWFLPDGDAPPAFFALGNVAGTTVGAQGVRVTHVADRPEAVWRMGLIALQRRAMAWLTEVMRVERGGRLLVVWLGMNPASGRASGAAGDRSFVSGYVAGDPRGSSLSLMTLAHEQFHQLAALTRPGDHPAWYGESLAQFYALRALSRLGSRQREIQALRDKFIDASRPVPATLLDWQRRHEEGDAAAYPQFYTQGATFWHQLDALLRQATEGQHTLDQDLPALLALPTDAATPLPATLRQQWRTQVGPAVDVLIRRYVGG